jgi:hypothetical protein
MHSSNEKDSRQLKGITMAKRKDEKKKAEELATLTDRLLAGESLDPQELEGLGGTVQRLRKSSQQSPDPAFATRLRNLAMAALPKPAPSVSERLQAVISKLLGDEDFRTSFFASPEATLQRAGFQLSPAEIAALKEMEPENLQEWMTDLDERISKSGLL